MRPIPPRKCHSSVAFIVADRLDAYRKQSTCPVIACVVERKHHLDFKSLVASPFSEMPRLRRGPVSKLEYNRMESM